MIKRKTIFKLECLKCQRTIHPGEEFYERYLNREGEEINLITAHKSEGIIVETYCLGCGE